VLRVAGEQVESLFDEALPIEVRELPADLARLDGLLGDHTLLAPIAAQWAQASRDRGRPTIAMTMFVRLMVIKQRTGWGYETLVRRGLGLVASASLRGAVAGGVDAARVDDPQAGAAAGTGRDR
jgi:IS5 family transposase